MTHEQLQAAQRAALSLGLNINSAQAAAIINAALRAQQEADPVAYVLFRDGEVCYEADDNIVISNKPGDSSDLFQWLPVFAAPEALQPDDLTHCACGDAYPATSYGAGFIDGPGMCPNCDAALPPKDIEPGKIAVSVEPLRQVLHALISAPHLIRELQVTREPAALFKDNPINILVDEFNAAADRSAQGEKP